MCDRDRGLSDPVIPLVALAHNIVCHHHHDDVRDDDDDVRDQDVLDDIMMVVVENLVHQSVFSFARKISLS